MAQWWAQFDTSRVKQRWHGHHSDGWQHGSSAAVNHWSFVTVSLGKTLHSAYLTRLRCKWVPAKAGGKTCDRLASCPGGDLVSSVPLNATETGISSGSMVLMALNSSYFKWCKSFPICKSHIVPHHIIYRWFAKGKLANRQTEGRRNRLSCTNENEK